MGEAIRSLPMMPSVVTLGTPSLTSATSNEVPPMSTVMTFLKPCVAP